MIFQILKIFSLAALLAAANFFIPAQNKQPDNSGAIIAPAEITQNQPVSELPGIEAKSVYVFDVFKNEVLFQINAETQLPLASLTKLMTAVIARENMAASAEIIITGHAVASEGDSGFKVGEKIQLEDIIKIMLIQSSNDAAYAIGENFEKINKNAGQTFADLMNKKATELGLNQTYFLNTSGIDLSPNQAGAFGSAKDLAKLMEYIIEKHSDLLEITAKENLSYGGRLYKNTNSLLSKLSLYIGGKTGFSDLAGGNLVIAADKGLAHHIIIVVLGSGEEGRFKDVELLYNKFINGVEYP